MDLLQATKNVSDIEIISRILEGEVDLYEVIIRRYNSYLYRVGKSYGYSHSDVEDLMQETYVNAYKHLRGFEHRASFKTWLVKIMLHQCYHKKQKFSYQKESPVTTEFSDAVKPFYNDNELDGNKTVQNLELKEIIEAAMLRIPEDYRIVFTLRELNGLSTSETATTLHITESNVKVRLNRAKGMLRQEIAKTYSPKEIFEFNLIYCDAMVERVMKQIKSLEN